MANQIGNAIQDAENIFANINQFDDSAQIMEIVEILRSEGGMSIRASACQGIVTFFNEEYGAFT